MADNKSDVGTDAKSKTDGSKDSRDAKGSKPEIPKHVMVIAIIAFFLSSSLVAVSWTYGWKGQIRILTPSNLNLYELESFGNKLQFTARYWVLPLLFLFTRWHAVVTKRITTRAIDPLSGNEKYVEKANKILNNCMEQLLMSVVSQVCLLSYLTPEQTVSLIPLINLWHVIGRIAFLLGYPKYRTFGVNATMLPTTITIFFCLYHFVTSFLKVI